MLIIFCHQSTYLYNRELKKCKQCEFPIETSIQLPCEHVICHNCVKEMNITKMRKCPECKEEWSEEDKLTDVTEQQ